MRFPATPDDSWLARPILNHAAGEFSSSSAQVVTVAGFGAVQTTTGLGPTEGNCQLYIDVAPNQTLEVQYDNVSNDRPGLNHQTACQLASQVAGLIIANLHANQTAPTGNR